MMSSASATRARRLARFPRARGPVVSRADPGRLVRSPSGARGRRTSGGPRRPTRSFRSHRATASANTATERAGLRRDLLHGVFEKSPRQRAPSDSRSTCRGSGFVAGRGHARATAFVRSPRVPRTGSGARGTYARQKPLREMRAESTFSHRTKRAQRSLARVGRTSTHSASFREPVTVTTCASSWNVRRACGSGRVRGSVGTRVGGSDVAAREVGRDARFASDGARRAEEPRRCQRRGEGRARTVSVNAAASSSTIAANASPYRAERALRRRSLCGIARRAFGDARRCRESEIRGIAVIDSVNAIFHVKASDEKRLLSPAPRRLHRDPR